MNLRFDLVHLHSVRFLSIAFIFHTFTPFISYTVLSSSTFSQCMSSMLSSFTHPYPSFHTLSFLLVHSHNECLSYFKMLHFHTARFIEIFCVLLLPHIACFTLYAWSFANVLWIFDWGLGWNNAMKHQVKKWHCAVCGAKLDRSCLPRYLKDVVLWIHKLTRLLLSDDTHIPFKDCIPRVRKDLMRYDESRMTQGHRGLEQKLTFLLLLTDTHRTLQSMQKGLCVTRRIQHTWMVWCFESVEEHSCFCRTTRSDLSMRARNKTLRADVHSAQALSSETTSWRSSIFQHANFYLSDVCDIPCKSSVEQSEIAFCDQACKNACSCAALVLVHTLHTARWYAKTHASLQSMHQVGKEVSWDRWKELVYKWKWSTSNVGNLSWQGAFEGRPGNLFLKSSWRSPRTDGRVLVRTPKNTLWTNVESDSPGGTQLAFAFLFM